MVFFSLLADRIGYGPLMGVAFVLHALSAVLTLAASFVFTHYGKQHTYWVLYLGMTLFALANGTCEAVINPLAAICALSMLLRHSGKHEKAAGDIERAVMEVVKKLKSLSAGKMGYSTTEVGDLVVDSL